MDQVPRHRWLSQSFWPWWHFLPWPVCSSGDDATGTAVDAAAETATEVTEALASSTTTTVPTSSTTQTTFAFPDASPGRDGPVVYQLAPHVPVGQMASIEGPVSIDGKGCLRVGSSGVVWPAGTSWDHETNELVLDGDQRVALGGYVRGGGGYTDSSIVKELEMSSLEFDVGAEVATHTIGCYGTGQVAVVNNFPQAIGPAEPKQEDLHPGAVPNHASG